MELWAIYSNSSKGKEKVSVKKAAIVTHQVIQQVLTFDIPSEMVDSGEPLAQAYAVLALSTDESHTVAEVVKAYK